MLNHLHSHGPAATADGSFAAFDATAGGGSSAGSSATFSDDAIRRSVFAFTAFDSGAVERALPVGAAGWGTRVPTQPREMQVPFKPAHKP